MAEYFIHPNGNDATAEADDPQKPYATPDAAFAETFNPGDIISFMYDPSFPVHTQTAQLSVTASGTPTAPIRIRSVNANGTYDGSRSVLQVGIAGFPMFGGTGRNIYVSDLDLGGWNDSLFHTITQWRLDRIRQITRPAGGSNPFGVYFLESGRYCLVADCQQLVSRYSFVSNANTIGGNIYLRCYSKFGFTIGGDRKSEQLIYCVADGVSGIGFNVSLAYNYIAVGGSLYGCISKGCTTGFQFANGGVSASRLVALNCTGNGIQLAETGASGGIVALTDSIITGCGGYGLERLHATSQLLMESRNFWYNNTSGHIKDGTVDASSFADVDPKLNATTLQLAADSPARRVLMSIGADAATFASYIDAGALYGVDVGGTAGGIWLPNKRGNKQ